MATADELLASLNTTSSRHTHTVVDPDSHFVIDPNTREISNASRFANVLMQNDHDSERFTFELPRYVEGHDMTLCNVVKVHYNNIESGTNKQNADTYDVYDLQVSAADPSIVTCTWLISRQATSLAGILSFLVEFMCVEDGGEVVYEWHTDIYSDVEVKAGRENGAASVAEYTDILEQWRDRLFDESGNPSTGGGTVSVKKFNITLAMTGWYESEDSSHYYQRVNYAANPNGRIELNPTPQQLIYLINAGIAMFPANANGEVTVYSTGGTPDHDMTLEATEEVVVYT